MLVSIIMPVKNEEKTIRESLNSLVNQTHRDKEIIVVAGDSTDRTIEIISNEFKGVVLLVEKGKNYPEAMNIGLKHARGEIVFITEGDAKYDKDYLKYALEDLKPADVAGVIGKIKLWVRERRTLLSSYYENDLNIRFHNYVPQSAWVYRKKIMEEAGYFDERMTFTGPDIALGQKVKKLGYKLIYEPKCLWFHEYEQSYFSFLYKALYSSKTAIPFYLMQPSIGFKRVRGPLFALLLLLLTAAYVINQYSIAIALVLFSAAYLAILLNYLKNYKLLIHKRAVIIAPLIKFALWYASLVGLIMGIQVVKANKINICRLI